jgi:hypothetical protein
VRIATISAANNTLRVVTLAGIAPLTIDTNVTDAFIPTVASSAVYTKVSDVQTSTTGALWRGPTASVIVADPGAGNPGGFLGLLGHTSDGTQALGYSTRGANNATDIIVAPTAAVTTPITPITLLSATTGAVMSDAFTTDDTHALYLKDFSAGTGTLMANLITPPGIPIQLGTNVRAMRPALTAHVVFSDAYVPGVGPGTGDLKYVDTAQFAPATLIAAQASVDFFLTAAKDKVVYALYGAPNIAGLYVATLP